MHTFKRLISYSPYLLILLVVLPVFAEAEGSIFSLKDILWTFVNNIFGFLIGASGILLNYAVNEYVIGFGRTWATGLGGAIDLSWVVVRDVFNIAFIFGLVWLGFKMILRSDDSNTRRTLISLIMAALLVNFSLFITKFIVDFTNILATQLAGAFIGNPIGNAAEGSAQISEKFMQLFGLSAIWDGNWINEVPGGAEGSSYTYIFGTAIVFLIGAFCFAAGGIMLIIRFAALSIYMVFSPLMFLGWVFPGLKSVSNKYWSGFLGRAFYAPAYMMLIYLAAYVMGSLQNQSTGFDNVFADPTQANIDASIAPFMLTCVFLIASVVVAGKMSADGASTAMKLGNNLRGRAQRGLKNTAMFVPRRAARAGAGATANVARRMDNRLLSSDTKAANFGRKALATVGLDARTRNNMIESGRNAKMGTNYSTADNEKNRQEQQTRRNKAQDERKREETVEENIYDALHGEGNIQTDAINKIAGAFAKMSMEERSKIDPKLLKSPEFAKVASDADVKAMAESGYFSNDYMKEFKEGREEGTFSKTFSALENTESTVDNLNDALDELGETVRSFSEERVEGLSDDKLKDERVATNLTQTQFDNAMKSKNLSTEKKAWLKNARKTGFAKIASQGTVVDVSASKAAKDPDFKKKFVQKRRAKLFSQSTQDAGKLPPEVFSHKDMAQHITPAALQQRMRNGLDEEERSAIEANIKTYINKGTPESDRAKKVWQKWSNGNNTEGNQFDFGSSTSQTQTPAVSGDGAGNNPSQTQGSLRDRAQNARNNKNRPIR